MHHYRQEETGSLLSNAKLLVVIDSQSTDQKNMINVAEIFSIYE